MAADTSARCKVCNWALTQADLDGPTLPPADCCGRDGLCIACRPKGAHVCDPAPTEADIRDAIDFGRTADQHLRLF